MSFNADSVLELFDLLKALMGIEALTSTTLILKNYEYKMFIKTFFICIN